MTPGLRVVLDTDFLSAFLKIDQLPLVRESLGVDEFLIPPAVLREIGQANLLPRIVDMPWIVVQSPDTTKAQALRFEDLSSGLGPGEREAIAICLERQDSVLLMNDNRARAVAARLGVKALNIPTFLLEAKLSSSLSQAQIEALVVALEKFDRYGFKKAIREELLS